MTAPAWVSDYGDDERVAGEHDCDISGCDTCNPPPAKKDDVETNGVQSDTCNLIESVVPQKARKRFALRDGCEVRGMMIRLYPTREQETELLELEHESRVAWNYLVTEVDNALDATRAYAIRSGLVGPRPTAPIYDGLTPEESKAARRAYVAACGEWATACYSAVKPDFRKFRETLAHFGARHDYQLLTKVIAWRLEADVRSGRRESAEVKSGAHILQALTRHYFQKSKYRKKRRKSIDAMPIAVRSGHCFEVGLFGQRRGKDFYNCRIKINGLKILGRLPGVAPTGRVLEGVSVRWQADGWWASIKQELPVRERAEAVPGTIVGLDVGLHNIVGMSDGTIVPNRRGRAFAERIAGRQALRLPVGRLQLQAQRHNRHEIYNKIVKPLARVETIKIERLTPRIGQMGSPMQSSMRLIRSLLVQRYGDRVREVEPAYTSQDCSQCGTRSKETWSYEHGRIGVCPQCGHSEDRDVNAARNIVARPAISEGS